VFVCSSAKIVFYVGLDLKKIAGIGAMSIIFLPNNSTGPARKVGRNQLIAALVALVLFVPSVAVVVGYLAGKGAAVDQREAFVSGMVQDQLEAQRSDLLAAKQDAQENINALTLRLAELQSRVIRLDALGQRLTEMAKLDKGEFNFDEKPSLGGPAQVADLGEADLGSFLDSFDVLAKQLEDREQQLAVLESLMMSRSLEEEVFPAGFPAEKGWISSRFGIRTDPFTGRPARHDGIDIAGKLGSKVLSVASGVVTWSGERYGYGNLVEVNHGNGYVTRYAHNSEHLVAVGDTVKKGQPLALMGSSGRSTGPHIHFEVLRHGNVVNPLKYVRASRQVR